MDRDTEVHTTTTVSCTTPREALDLAADLIKDPRHGHSPTIEIRPVWVLPASNLSGWSDKGPESQRRYDLIVSGSVETQREPRHRDLGPVRLHNVTDGES